MEFRYWLAIGRMSAVDVLTYGNDLLPKQMRDGGVASVPHFISVQISRSFQLGAVVEGVAHLLAQHTVCVVDGVKGDGPQLVRVDRS